MAETDLFGKIYNPDVLTCLANLSNDEVFTPPDVANAMLDMLPQELFSNPDTKFLDPACKSGVFLREIAKRLLKGLESQIPDLQRRIEHIFRKQLYGIAITELTSLLSRRSVYCSKYPNSGYSVCKFDDAEGNIRFRRIQHSWLDGKCKFCGVSQLGEFSNENRHVLETHAYEFIHYIKAEEIFNMKFDVIISNPPYQIASTKEARYAKAIYNLFVTQAKKLNPQYMTMIIPSRWFSGGLGLDDFRKEMLSDNRIKEIHDFPNASDCFPGVEIKGGVNYFLWSKEYHGDCKIVTHKNNKVISISERPLLEKGMTTFVRNNDIISILRKISAFNEKSFSEIVGSYDPFGFDVREKDSYKRVRIPFSTTKRANCYELYYNGWRKNGVGYVKKDLIKKGQDLIDNIKIFFPKAWGVGDFTKDWIKPFCVGKNSCCTETYLVVGPFKSIKEAENCISYTQTRFFHLLVSLIKITQNTMQGAYEKVPVQTWSKPWTDKELYAKYKLTQEEIDFIDSMIKPMEVEG